MREDPELIRPSEKTSLHGWCGAVDGEEQGCDPDQVVEEAEVQERDELKVDDEAEGSDDVNESEKPRMLKSAAIPSRQEVLEHNALSISGLVRRLCEWEESCFSSHDGKQGCR